MGKVCLNKGYLATRKILKSLNQNFFLVNLLKVRN